MSEILVITFQVYGLGFVISMVVALLIKLTHMAIDASTKS